MTDTHIAEIRARWAGVGPWYPRATDDDMFMNARYVCTEPGPTNAYGEWTHDNKRSMGLSDEQQDSRKVIAITLLQYPRLADHEDCDENTERMAGAPDDIRDILAALDAATDERDDAEKLMLDAVCERNDFVVEAHQAKAERDAALARVKELENRPICTPLLCSPLTNRDKRIAELEAVLETSVVHLTRIKAIADALLSWGRV